MSTSKAPKASSSVRTSARAKAPARAGRSAASAKLPPALVANAAAVRERAQTKLRARGEAAVEIIREKLGDVAENVLDMGAAAKELMLPGVPEAMGYANFDDVCRSALGVHPETIRRWRALAENVSRRFVLQVGLGRAEALMELCDATPADDVPEDVFAATLTLPTGKRLVVAKATAEQILDAAKAFRHARADAEGAPARGFTTTAGERKAHAQIAKRLQKAPPAAHAATRLVAQRDADGAKVVLEVRLAAWDATIALFAKG